MVPFRAATRPASAVAQPEGAPLSSSDSSAVAFLAEPIDTGITFGAWMAVHPRDSVGIAIPTNFPAPIVCRTAATHFSIAGIALTRRAVFAVPPVPRGEALPADGDTARRWAVEEYRAALAGLRGRDDRRAAWTGAMRSMLGLGNFTVFACGAGD